MALIYCPGCGKQVSEYAKACPNCGYSVQGAFASFMENERQVDNESADNESAIFTERPIRENKDHSKGYKIAIVILSVLAVGSVAFGAVSISNYTALNNLKQENDALHIKVGELEQKRQGLAKEYDDLGKEFMELYMKASNTPGWWRFVSDNYKKYGPF